MHKALESDNLAGMNTRKGPREWRIRIGRYSVTADYKLFLLMALAMPLTIGLGVWQIQRGQEKSQLQQAFDRTFNTAPVSLETLYPLEHQARSQLYYRPIKVSGRFDNERTLFLDNQTHEGRAGFHVITPLLLATGEAILVNRGWVPLKPANRNHLPTIEPVMTPLTLTGFLKQPSDAPFLLKEQSFNTPHWPLLVQALELDKFQSLFPYPLLDWLVLLHPNEVQYGFVRAWKPISMPAEKHYAYAFQWFALCIALLVIFLVTHTRR